MNSKRTGMGFRTLALLASILAASFCAALLNAQQNSGTFVSIDFPGAIFTLAGGINARGDIVGCYTLPDGSSHGFLLSKGIFTSIDVSGAVATAPTDINSTGSIVGLYFDSQSTSHGFLLSNGAFTTVDFPGAASTVASGINARGEIVGFYCPTSTSCGSPLPPTAHGFVLSRGIFTSFDPPGSIFNANPRISSQGHIAGYFQSADGMTHVYLLSAGTFTTFDPPGPVTFFKTASPGINPQGQIVGYYVDAADGRAHGFLLSAGSFSTIDIPGAINNCNFAINASGQIVGIYQSADGISHGFLLTRRQ